MSLNRKDINRLLGKTLGSDGSGSEFESPTLKALVDRVSTSTNTRDVYERALQRQAQQDRLFDAAYKQQLQQMAEQEKEQAEYQKRQAAIQTVAQQRYDAAVTKVTKGDETARSMMESSGTLNDAVNKELAAELSVAVGRGDQFEKDGSLKSDYLSLIHI